jgi:hypothetical protein
MFSFTLFLTLLLLSSSAYGFHRSVILSYKLLSRSKISHSHIIVLSSDQIDGNNDSIRLIVKKDKEPNVVNGFDLILSALLHYKIRHHSLLVPQRFTIPIDSLDWPKEVWGLRLGNIVRKIRKGQSYKDRRGDLLKIGFSFDLLEDKYDTVKSEDRYDTVKSALLRYKDLHGDMLVPMKFQIDANSDWPQVIWTLKLGQIVNDIRLNNLYDKHYNELLSIGFCYDLLQVKFELIMTALVRYSQLNGNLLVSRKFIVPKSDEWPKNSWGLRLGYYVYQIRAKEIYSDKLEDLIRIGFDLDSTFHTDTKEILVKTQSKGNQTFRIFGFDEVKLAMLEFKSRLGHLDIPKDFIIPDQSEGLDTSSSFDNGKLNASVLCLSGINTPNLGIQGIGLGIQGIDLGIWPDAMRGMNLGKISSDIRKGIIHADKREELLLIGVPMAPKLPIYNYELLRIAFVRYSRLYGDLDLSINFVVPVRNKDWPEETWGMMLGAAARGIRKGNFHIDQKEDLISIGFQYKIVTYKLVKLALLKYKNLNYHMLVPHRFIVPKAREWGEETWGLKLGNI